MNRIVHHLCVQSLFDVVFVYSKNPMSFLFLMDLWYSWYTSLFSNLGYCAANLSPPFLHISWNFFMATSFWYPNSSIIFGQSFLLCLGVERHIICVKSSASCLEIVGSAESFLFVEIHILICFNIFIDGSISNLLFLGCKIWTWIRFVSIGASNSAMMMNWESE